jgi:farnesyl diphosphate synthase
MQRYSAIVKYKTAFYSFYLPVALGMIVAGVTDAGHFAKAKEILCVMGEYFQVQDDYLDCYGTFEQIGKHGTDIQECKCSWLVVQALSLCDTKQRKLLEAHYGRTDAKSVEAIKKLYRDLNLENLFTAYEEESYAAIKKSMAQCKFLPEAVFDFLLKKIYKRSK